MPNAILVVSVNYGGAPASVREPPPCRASNPINRWQFMEDVFVVNSGYRTRYPDVAVATKRPAGREEFIP